MCGILVGNENKLKSEATLQEISESLLNEAVEPKTITFPSGSAIYWNDSEDCCESVLNSVNCSSVSIDDSEED